jgi:hypothetical protein
VNGPPNKKREKLSLKNFTRKKWKRPYSKGKIFLSERFFFTFKKVLSSHEGKGRKTPLHQS